MSLQFRAESGGEPVSARKINKHTWRVAPVPGELLVRITVYAADPSVRGAWLDDQQGFVNGVCVFLQVHGQEHTQSVVHIDPPEYAGELCPPPRAGACPRDSSASRGGRASSAPFVPPRTAT